jgi:hypothetical protein
MECAFSSENYAYEVNRESATSILGWPMANPGFSSRFRFAMARCRRLERFRVEVLGRGPEGRLAQCTSSAL